jgi:hypothetical protein
MCEFLAFRLNQALEDCINSQQFDWNDINGELLNQLDTLFANLNLIKTALHRQEVKSYLLENGFCLQALMIAHKDDIQHNHMMGAFDKIIMYYKYLLYFL